tara:strand:- start:941 stop:1363 length:423 start_codon:yes stop_codon:yes gene_type:complete
MLDLPKSLLDELKEPTYKRDDSSVVKAALDELGLSPSSLFVEFFETYEGPFWSEKLGYEMLDIISESPNMVEHTTLCREQYEFPAEYLVLTEITTGQVAVLNVSTDQVYEVDFEGGDELLKNAQLKPRWLSFREYLTDYF